MPARSGAKLGVSVLPATGADHALAEQLNQHRLLCAGQCLTRGACPARGQQQRPDDDERQYDPKRFHRIRPRLALTRPDEAERHLYISPEH